MPLSNLVPEGTNLSDYVATRYTETIHALETARGRVEDHLSHNYMLREEPVERLLRAEEAHSAWQQIHGTGSMQWDRDVIERIEEVRNYLKRQIYAETNLNGSSGAMCRAFEAARRDARRAVLQDLDRILA